MQPATHITILTAVGHLYPPSVLSGFRGRGRGVGEGVVVPGKELGSFGKGVGRCGTVKEGVRVMWGGERSVERGRQV